MSMPSSRALVAASPISSPARSCALELAALLGQVAAAVGRDLPGQRRVDLGQQLGGGDRDLLGAAPRPDERQGADVLGDQVGEQVGGLRGRGPAQRGAVLAGEPGQRRLPQRQRRPRRAASRRRSRRARRDRSAGPAAASGSATVAEASTNVGARAVGRADPAQPAQHLGDVRAEHPAVVVALVDHDVAAAGTRKARQRSWPGSSERCSMSGLVSTYSAWSRAHSRWSRLLSPSWVVTRTSRPERGEPGELVLGQRLGRREVERGGAALAARLRGRRAAEVSAGSW